MQLIWTSPETVTIPNVGTVTKGRLFSIDEDRGRDLLERGLVSRPIQETDKETAAKEAVDRKKSTKGIDAAPQGKE